MDFTNASELLELCNKNNMSISQVMRQREIDEGKTTDEEIDARLDRVFDIMSHAIREPLHQPLKTMGGLIGGEARNFRDYILSGNNMCGSFMGKAVLYSLAVLEESSSMGLIVAAPTAGSSGVLPGILMAAREEFDMDDDEFRAAVLNAGAIGYLLVRNSSVSGAEAGCQAEIGSAAAMAASALVEYRGGTPEMCLHGASIAISNMLGLVCDPIAGLVECPCQYRNGMGVANAIYAADLAMAGNSHRIPFDEMAECMRKVGKSLPYQLRETALGGCAATPTGCALRAKVLGKDNSGPMEPLNRSRV